MADLQTLFRTVDELSADELNQHYLYISQTRLHLATSPEQSLQPRVLGLFEDVGKTWTSDDFDAELPDSFWFGDEPS